MASRTQTQKEFDTFLETILRSLPEDIVQLLDRIPLVVDDEPPADLGADICGLHSGIPLSEQSVFETPMAPEVVQLFRGPILRLAAGDEARLKREIRITLLHELGHHFGLSEERLRELGYD